MYDLVCIDCLTEFEEIDLIDKACPNCGSTHYDWYDDVFEDDNGWLKHNIKYAYFYSRLFYCLQLSAPNNNKDR